MRDQTEELPDGLVDAVGDQIAYALLGGVAEFHPVNFDPEGRGPMAALVRLLAIGAYAWRLAEIDEADGRATYKKITAVNRDHWSSGMGGDEVSAKLAIAFEDGAFRKRQAEVEERNFPEAALQEAFLAQLGQLIPGAIPMKITDRRRGSCDALLSKAGEERPVEIKAKHFGRSARRQLREYMLFYQSSHGYAVAPKLTCDLDPDMTFIPFTGRA